jgi:hypothetical protein
MAVLEICLIVKSLVRGIVYRTGWVEDASELGFNSPVLMVGELSESPFELYRIGSCFRGREVTI